MMKIFFYSSCVVLLFLPISHLHAMSHEQRDNCSFYVQQSNQINIDNSCSLWTAAHNGDTEAVKRLLSNPAVDKNIVGKSNTSNYYTTPLAQAIISRHPDIVLLLNGHNYPYFSSTVIDNDPSILNQRLAVTYTANAILYGNTDLIAQLKQNKQFLNQALWVAATQGDAACVDKCLENAADCHAQDASIEHDKANKTALDMTLDNKHSKIVTQFIQHDPNIIIQPLLAQNTEVIRKLIEAGAHLPHNSHWMKWAEKHKDTNELAMLLFERQPYVPTDHVVTLQPPLSPKETPPDDISKDPVEQLKKDIIPQDPTQQPPEPLIEKKGFVKTLVSIPGQCFQTLHEQRGNIVLGVMAATVALILFFQYGLPSLEEIDDQIDKDAIEPAGIRD
jgi:hypothetical protein